MTSSMNKIALAGLATAALVLAPSAAADVPGIVQFVGTWHAHEEGLHQTRDGSNRPVPMHRRLAAARQGPWISR
jgi:hypothetical protein